MGPIEITFSWLQIIELNISAEKVDSPPLGEIEYTFDFTVGFTDESPRMFAIKYFLDMHSMDNKFTMKIVAVAHFDLNIDIDPVFKDSPFVNVNAPAIGFPYVRTFISNLTLNMGYAPIVLPSFNFEVLARQKTINKENSLKSGKENISSAITNIHSEKKTKDT